MQIKRFEARDIQEALRQVKEAMGPEAIILSTKTLKHPLLQGYKDAKVEVVAAMDRPNDPAPKAHFSPFQPSPVSAPVLKAENKVQPEKEKVQIDEDKVIDRILSCGFPLTFIHQVVDDLKSLRKEMSGYPTGELYRGLLRMKLMEQIDVTGPSLEGAKIWSFIGPTGVGKTTTLVKLAADFSLKVTPKITLVTLDTYRIGAVEQLRTYAEILRLPLEVALSREDLGRIIEKHKHQDLLLIDTAGRGPGQTGPIEELKAFLTVHPCIENHLLLSATTKESDLELAVKRFRQALPIKSYIFTKLDETEQYVPIFNQLLRSKAPLSYLTTGQRVPEDIELATKARMANLVLNQIQWN